MYGPHSTYEELRAAGFARWDKPDKDGNVLMLIPKRLLDQVDPDCKVVTILGGEVPLAEVRYDDDTRFRFLAYGFKVKFSGNK